MLRGVKTSKSTGSSRREGESAYVKRVAPRALRSTTCTMSSGTLSASFGEGFARTKDTAPGVTTDLAASMAALLFEAGLSAVEGFGWADGGGGDESS
jgi:hypothetical protein